MGECFITRRGGIGNSSGTTGFPEFTYTGQCTTLLNDGIASDGKTQNWRIKFLTSGDLKFTKLGSGSNGMDVFLVGGGGGSSYRGAGGGGYTKTETVQLSADTLYTIVIGAGGSGNTNGGETSAFGITAAGGEGTAGSTGAKGGSGGGGTGWGSYSGTGGNGGSDGNDGGKGAGDQTSAAGGTGQGTTTREFGETNGDLYAGGGGARGRATNGTGGSGGGGDATKNGEINTGGGGGGVSGEAATSGGSGIIVIRNAR